MISFHQVCDKFIKQVFYFFGTLFVHFFNLGKSKPNPLEESDQYNSSNHFFIIIKLTIFIFWWHG